MSTTPSSSPSTSLNNNCGNQNNLSSNKDVSSLYKSVKWQNEMIDVETAKMRDSYSTDNQRSKHMINNIMGWNYLNFYLWIVYYIIVAVVIYLFVKGNIEIEKKYKYYISFGLLLYPFLITTIELIIYNFIDFLKSVMIGIPYPKHSDQQPSFSVFNGLPTLYY